MMCDNSNTRLLSRLIIDFLVLIGLYGVALVVLPQTLRTYERGFHCQDATLHYPYRQSSVTKVHLTILVVALPAAVMLVGEMLRAAFVQANDEEKQRFVFVGVRIPSFISECYKIIGVYLYGLAITLIVTRVTKYRLGHFRPYFFDVCQPTWSEGPDTRYCPPLTGAYIEAHNCTEFASSADLLAIVRHSFPSGFASTSAYAMIFLIFYAQARLVASWLRMLRTVLQFICFVLAVYVALERVASFQNHWTDAAAGFGLGFAVATLISFFVGDLVERARVRSARLPRKEKIYSYYQRSTYGL